MDRSDWAEAVATALLRRDQIAAQSAERSSQEIAQLWEQRIAHATAQETLFQLYGVRFAHYEAFQAFPRVGCGGAAAVPRCLPGRGRSRVRPPTGVARGVTNLAVRFLSHEDARLRRAAVQRMIDAVGEQSIPLKEVLDHLQARLREETSETVFEALLQAGFELALAAGPESRLASDWRDHLFGLRETSPDLLGPALMDGFERLPRSAGLPASDYAQASELMIDLFEGSLRLDAHATGLGAASLEPARRGKAA